MTLASTNAQSQAFNDEDEITAQRSPDESLLQRARMSSVNLPPNSGSGVHALSDAARSPSNPPPPLSTQRPITSVGRVRHSTYPSPGMSDSPEMLASYEAAPISYEAVAAYEAVTARQRQPSYSSLGAAQPTNLETSDSSEARPVNEPSASYDAPIQYGAEQVEAVAYDETVVHGAAVEYGEAVAYAELMTNAELMKNAEPMPNETQPPLSSGSPSLHYDDSGLLPMSVLRTLLARYKESAGPAARPIILFEIAALGVTPHDFPRLLGAKLLRNIAERLDISKTRQDFVHDARRILDDEAYA